MEAAIQIRGLQKSYTPGVPVLSDFDFDLQKGEVHALIGSNGAGKSTLAKILTGLTLKNHGEIELFGQPYAPASKQEATQAGVNMVLQELNIIPTLTVAENLLLHSLPHRFGVLDRRKTKTIAEEALSRVGLTGIDPECRAATLGIGQQQMVEIAGALAQQSSVLIMDEPTAALTSREIDILFENITRLKNEGVAIIYISHRMDEISRISDRITVLRDGRRIATHDAKNVATPQLIREMAGNEIATRTSATIRDQNIEIGLKVENLCSGKQVRGVSFEANRGEISGIAGLIGSGRTETLRAIFGADPVESGSIFKGGDLILNSNTPASSVRAGIAMIPEDRKKDGLLLTKSVTTNSTIASLHRHATRGIIDHEAEEIDASSACDQLSVKRNSMDQAVSELSGGNQQKIVIARWLLCDCDVFLFDEPTRGVDVAAKETIYELLDKLTAEGKTIIVVSSDLTELMSISHRIVVMSNGRITGEFTPDSWTQELITAAAFAGYENKSGEAA